MAIVLSCSCLERATGAGCWGGLLGRAAGVGSWGGQLGHDAGAGC